MKYKNMKQKLLKAGMVKNEAEKIRIEDVDDIDIMCYEDFANAIVLQAVEDYKVAQATLLIYPHHEEAKTVLKNLEDFFYSPWCEMLTKLAPEILISSAKKVAEKEKIKMLEKMS